MNLDLDLKELGARLAKVDIMIMTLLKRRMELASQVGLYKMKQGGKFIRIQIENQRLASVRKWARKNNMNPHFVNSILYASIGESCKKQLIQLQSLSKKKLKSPQNEDQWYKMLKNNLLKLTESWSKSYDEDYDTAYFATHSYFDFEKMVLEKEIEQLTERAVLLDLGCATGRMTLQLVGTFQRAVGYDISPHMIDRAKSKLQDKEKSNVSFKQTDLENGIPELDETVSFAIMNLGTASDMKNIAGVLKEIDRVLKPGGRFFLSFYNKDALIYRWDFLPWPTGLAALINVHKHCLDVHMGNKEVSVYARPYTVEEVRSLFCGEMQVSKIFTYPTISSILPSDLFENQLEVQKSMTELDRSLTNSNMGAYIIVTGCKP